jgi:putative ABC transport system permease protein
VLGMAIAAVGLYGLMAYTVSLRMRDLGIRAALGAEPRRLSRLVLADAGRLVAAGLVLGLVIAIPSVGYVKGMVLGSTADPLTFAAAPVLLMIVGLAAAYGPGRRAARIDPMRVLRTD